METVLRARPDVSAVAAALAGLLATAPEAALRDGPRAVQLAEGAAQRTEHRDAEALNSLAAAYAAVGRFAEAADTAARALDIARAEKRTALEGVLVERLAHYRSGRPARAMPHPGNDEERALPLR